MTPQNEPRTHGFGFIVTFVLFVGFVVSLALTHAQTPSPPGPRAALTADDLFSGEALLDIWIHMNSRDWQQLRASFQENTFYPCDVEWRGERAYNAACRSRGQGSRSGVKPGLLVQFDRYVTGQTFLGLTSLVLDNLWQDSSMLKERASMRLFERMGLSAPRESHTRLYVGSGREYVGVYAVVENIDERFLQRKYGEHEGHLYEYRWRNEYYLTDLGDDFEPYAARFEPRNHETDSRFSLFKPIRDLIRAINAASESNLEADLAPYLDIRSFLAHVAVENVLSDWDGLLGDWGLDNFYLYRAAATNVSHVISWDKDYTFMWLEMPPSHRGEQNVLFKKAWAAPALRRYYLDRLNTAAAAADGWLAQEILREYGQIRAAALEDPLKRVSNVEFEEAVAEVLRFARERPAIVRSLVAQEGAGPALAGP